MTPSVHNNSKHAEETGWLRRTENLKGSDRFPAAESFSVVERRPEQAMNPQLDKLEAIFDRARQLSSQAAQGAYLAMACAGDDQLRRRIERMLEHDARAKEFFEPGTEAGEEARTGQSVATHFGEANLEGPGSLIDRYRLLEKIGEGAMGVVYMAQQEEPVRRQVALKIIKLGMDTKEVVARFEAERQALALMDHPNIARVLDGGATNAGRPFFVMELVRGVSVIKFCDKNHLSTEQRIKLFILVCEAIQSAHQKGIIHRDIKPTNILVAVNPDGSGMPKVIDFGVAKATNQKLTEKTLFTKYATMIGTPAYMSPEQAEMSNLDIDTRADIYGLGVVLYELLTGTTPFPEERLRSAGYNEMQRIIAYEEPERPSTRLSTLQGEQRSVVAQNRGLSELTLGRAFPGDLDWIVMKCLEKDRTRRYETANGLATDLHRHLQNEPVMARPPSRLYRLHKMLRRNRLVFAAAAAVAMALIVGLGLSSWLYLRERAARKRAVFAEQSASTEARKSDQVARFLTDMLTSVGPSAALGRDTTMVKEVLDKTSERIGRDLKGQPQVQAELWNTVGKVYEELGEYDRAEQPLRAAIEVKRTQAGKEDTQLAALLSNLGIVLERKGKLAEAETLHRHALAIQEQLGHENSEIAKTLSHIGNVLFRQGKLTEAEACYKQSLEMSRKVDGPESLPVAAALSNLGNVLGLLDRLDESEKMFREAMQLDKKLLSPEDPMSAKTLSNLGNTLFKLGKTAEAEAYMREAVAWRRKVLPPGHPDLAISINNLGCVLQEEGKYAEAELLHREALDIRRKKLGNDHPDLASSLKDLARALQAQGKLAEAESAYRDALTIRRKLPDYVALVDVLDFLGRTLIEEQKFGEAEAFEHEALDIAAHQFPDDWRTPAAKSLLGECLVAQGKFTEAEPLLIGVYEGLTQPAKDTSSGKAYREGAAKLLVRLYKATGRPEEANKWEQKSVPAK